MTATTRLWARTGPIAPHWQLGESTPAAGRFALVGWDTEPASVDAGVPPEVAGVLATGLARRGRVAFLRSTPPFAGTTRWMRVGDDLLRDATPPGFVERLRGGPSPNSLVCTRQAATIAALFDDAGCPWWLQSQVILLSDVDAPPPDVAAELAAACRGAAWTARADALRAAGVVAIASPGVDGDALGLCGLVEEGLERTLAALASAAADAGIAWCLRLDPDRLGPSALQPKS